MKKKMGGSPEELGTVGEAGGESGVKTSRASEPREVQFVIEQSCSQLVERFHAVPFPSSGLPSCIWIHWPGEPPIRGLCDSTVSYRVTDQSYRDANEHFGWAGRPGGMYVCEHMGQVIE